MICGYRLTYHPLYWGLVFPLGMYAVANEHMSRSMDLAFLRPVPTIFLYIALVAWLATSVGLAFSFVGHFKRCGDGPLPPSSAGKRQR